MTVTDGKNALTIPAWARALVPESPLSPDELMELAITLAVENARRDGGPFGAVAADAAGQVLSIGTNRVVTNCDSTWHAEVACLRQAQQHCNTHDLTKWSSPIALYTSCSPCIQCFGALYWSGIKQIYAAARSSDALAAGFDEGPVSSELWERARMRKGIELIADFHREPRGLEPFRVFAEQQGCLY